MTLHLVVTIAVGFAAFFSFLAVLEKREYASVKTLFKSSSLISGMWCCLALLLLVAFDAGSSAGHAARDRAELVWPDLMAMPAADRAVIVAFAQACKLETVRADRESVLGCLRSAAGAPDPVVPDGLTAAQARGRLEALIAAHPAG
mgnify:CR=1 FL=1